MGPYQQGQQTAGPGQRAGQGGNPTRCDPRNTAPQNEINNAPYRTIRTRHQQRPARESWEARQKSGCSTTRQTHPTAVRSIIVERSERAGSTPDWHGKTKRIPLPNRRSADGSVRMWTSKRDCRALPLLVSEVDGTSDGNAAMYQHPQRQHILLPGRKITIR